jgi:hypothetical protein
MFSRHADTPPADDPRHFPCFRCSNGSRRSRSSDRSGRTVIGRLTAE